MRTIDKWINPVSGKREPKHIGHSPWIGLEWVVKPSAACREDLQFKSLKEDHDVGRKDRVDH